MRLLSVVTLSLLGYAQADHPDDPAHQLDPHAEFLDSTVIDSNSGVITSTVALGSEVRCEAAHELGTAAHFYTDFVSTGGLIVPPDAVLYTKNSILAYKCGVVDSVTGDSLLFNHPPLLFDSFGSDNRILLTFGGECNTESVFFGPSNITNLGTYNGTQLYTALVSSSITYGCVQPHAFTGGVTAELSLQVAGVADFVSNTVFTLPLEFATTVDGKTFTITDFPLVFDLGTEKPHFDYYEAKDTCQSQLCKGSLILLSGNSKKTLITDLMDGTLMDKAVREVFKPCTNTAVNDEERIYTSQEACYGTYALVHDTVEEAAGNFLDPLECPFHNNVVISSPANVQACFDTASTFDNRCEASIARVVDPALLGNVFTEVLTATPAQTVDRSFTYSFVDVFTGTRKRFENVTLLDLNANPIFMEADQLYFDIELNLAAGQTFTELSQKAVGVKLQDPATGWSQFISLTGSQIIVTHIPRSVATLDLVGQVRTGCEQEEMSLLNGGAITLPIQLGGITSGRYIQVDPCTDLFLYYRDHYQQNELTITGTVGIQRLQVAQVRMCGTHTAGCETSTDVTVPFGSSSDLWAHIADVCHYERDLGVDSNGVMLQETAYVANGQTIGYILMDQNSGTTAHAPVICGGFCRDNVVRLPDLSLDWEVEFSADMTSYKLTADQGQAAYNDFKLTDQLERNFVLEKTAFLAPPTGSICQADGSISGTVPTDMVAPAGCLVYTDDSNASGEFPAGTASSFSGVTGALDMIDYLKTCGETLSDGSGAQAQLVQQFKIDYGSFDRGGLPQVESFCHSSFVTLFIETKVIGLSSATLAVTEVVSEAASDQIGVSIGNVAFQPCNGGYQVVATVDLQHSIVGETWTVDDTGSDFEAIMVPGFQAVQWQSECRDVCASESEYLTNWTNVTQSLVGEIEASGGAKAVVAFEVAISGTPCAAEDNFDGSGTVALDLYVAEGATCSDSDTRTNKSPYADESLCSHITFNHVGDFELLVTDSMMTRKAQGGLSQVLCEEAGDPGCVGDPRGLMFQVGRTLNASHNQATSSGMFALDQSDSFSNVTYVLFWEQNYMGNTRRLRSTHVFGEGQMTSYSTLTILPTSAQIGESTGGVTYDQTSGSTASSTTPSGATPSSSNSTSSSVDWGVIGAAAGGAVVVGGIGYYFYSRKKRSVVKTVGSLSRFFRNKPLHKPTAAQVRKNHKKGYTQVKRYERFTTDF